MEFLRSEVSGPEFLNFSRLDLLIINGSDSEDSRSRRKRGIIPTSLIIRRPIGDVINSAMGGISGALLKISVSVCSVRKQLKMELYANYLCILLLKTSSVLIRSASEKQILTWLGTGVCRR